MSYFKTACSYSLLLFSCDMIEIVIKMRWDCNQLKEPVFSFIQLNRVIEFAPVFFVYYPYKYLSIVFFKPSFYCNLQKEEWILLFFTLVTSLGVIFSSCFTLLNSQQSEAITFSLVLVLLVNSGECYLFFGPLTGMISK